MSTTHFSGHLMGCTPPVHTPRPHPHVHTLPVHISPVHTPSLAHISRSQVYTGIHTPPVNRMTHTCKNTTLPQIAFKDGN